MITWLWVLFNFSQEEIYEGRVLRAQEHTEGPQSISHSQLKAMQGCLASWHHQNPSFPTRVSLILAALDPSSPEGSAELKSGSSHPDVRSCSQHQGSLLSGGTGNLSGKPGGQGLLLGFVLLFQVNGTRKTHSKSHCDMRTMCVSHFSLAERWVVKGILSLAPTPGWLYTG